MEPLHVVNKGIYEVMRVLLDVNKLEVENTALKWQLSKILPKQSTFSPVQLGIPVSLYCEHCLFPEFTIQQHPFFLLYYRQFRSLFFLLQLFLVNFALFLHFKQSLKLYNAVSELSEAVPSHKHWQISLKHWNRSQFAFDIKPSKCAYKQPHYF